MKRFTVEKIKKAPSDKLKLDALIEGKGNLQKVIETERMFMMGKEQKDEYRFAYEIVDEKFHVRVFEPIITEEERERRMQKIKKATEIFLEDYYRREAIRERDKAKKQKNASLME